MEELFINNVLCNSDQRIISGWLEVVKKSFVTSSMLREGATPGSHTDLKIVTLMPH